MTIEEIDSALARVALTGWRLDALRCEIMKLIEEERKACAKIVHDVYLEWFDGSHSPGEAFESAKERIRARSDVKP